MTQTVYRQIQRLDTMRSRLGICAGLLLVICGSGKPTCLAQTAAPIPAVVATNALGLVQQNSHITARDGTWTALINGSSYWSFNDTALTEANAEGQNFFSNSRAWTTNLDASNGITLSHDVADEDGLPYAYFPFTSDENNFNSAHNSNTCTTATDPYCGEEYAIWPGPVIPVPGSTTGEVYHFYYLLMRGGAISGWLTVGQGVAHEQNGVISRVVSNPNATSFGGSSTNPPFLASSAQTLIWTGSQDEFGSGGWVENGTLYMLGQVGSGYAGIGKVAIGQMTNPSAWTYYDSNTNQWVTDETEVKPYGLFYGASGGGSSLQFNAALNEYMVIYSNEADSEVYFRVAAEPWGPWSAQQSLFTGQTGIAANGSADTTDHDYAAKGHPEFQQQNGLVQYVTYVQHNFTLNPLFGQQTQLVQVTFAPAQ